MTDKESEVEINIQQIKDYQFSVDFGLQNVPLLMVDEDPPLGEGNGPDPSRLLGAAVANCMLASLLFCLQKSRTVVNDLNAKLIIQFGRNGNKRLRIKAIDLEITVDLPDKELSKLERCRGIFEDFCTVSASVRTGIPVKVDIKAEKMSEE